MSVAQRWLVGYLVSLLVAVGVMVSIWDYIIWRRAEFGRYGQGPVTIAAQPLAAPMQSDWAGVRWSVPAGWSLTLTPAGSVIADRVLVASGGNGQARLSLWVEGYSGDLIGAAEAEARRRAGSRLAREREYLNTDTAHAVILTWAEKSDILQAALFAEKGKLVVLEAAAPTSAWSSFEPTFWAVYQSVVVF